MKYTVLVFVSKKTFDPDVIKYMDEGITDKETLEKKITSEIRRSSHMFITDLKDEMNRVWPQLVEAWDIFTNMKYIVSDRIIESANKEFLGTSHASFSDYLSCIKKAFEEDEEASKQIEKLHIFSNIEIPEERTKTNIELKKYLKDFFDDQTLISKVMYFRLIKQFDTYIDPIVLPKTVDRWMPIVVVIGVIVVPAVYAVYSWFR